MNTRDPLLDKTGLEGRIKDVRKVYEAGKTESAGYRPRNVDLGHWEPTHFEILIPELMRIRRLTATGVLSAKHKTLVAGAGDLRRSAGLAAMGYSNITAAEINPEIAWDGYENIERLESTGIIAPGAISMRIGSFLDDSQYALHHERFSDYGQIFGYLRKVNNDALLSKIENESAPGTHVFLLSLLDWKVPMTSLTEKDFYYLRPQTRGITHRNLTHYIKQERS